MQEIRFTSDKQYLFCRLFCISVWWPISLIWYNHYESEYEFEIEFKIEFKVKLKVKSEFKIKF